VAVRLYDTAQRFISVRVSVDPTPAVPDLSSVPAELTPGTDEAQLVTPRGWRGLQTRLPQVRRRHHIGGMVVPRPGPDRRALTIPPFLSSGEAAT
jgi:hypothetical protein